MLGNQLKVGEEMKHTLLIITNAFLIQSIFTGNLFCQSDIKINEINLVPSPQITTVQQTREFIELYNDSPCDSIDIRGWYIVTELNNRITTPVYGYSIIDSWSARYGTTMPVDAVAGNLITNLTQIPPKKTALILIPNWNASNLYLPDIPDETIILTPQNFLYWGADAINAAIGAINGLFYNDEDFAILYNGDPAAGATKIDSVGWTAQNGPGFSLQRDNDGIIRWYENAALSPAGGYEKDTDGSILGPNTIGKQNYTDTSKALGPVNFATLENDKSICYGQETTLSVQYNDSGMGYLWSNGETTANIQVMPLALTSYTVKAFGVCHDTISAIIAVNVLPLPSITIQGDTVGCSKQKTELMAFGGTDYVWLPKTGLSCNSCQNPVATLDADIQYYAIAIDNNGCKSAIDSIFIKVNSCETTYYAPNAFTPNGDLNNDTFQPIILYEEGASLKMIIYNRWGEPVYETTNIHSGWNGKIDSGVNATEGTYVWRINSSNGKEYKGHVNLIR